MTDDVLFILEEKIEVSTPWLPSPSREAASSHALPRPSPPCPVPGLYKPCRQQQLSKQLQSPAGKGWQKPCSPSPMCCGGRSTPSALRSPRAARSGCWGPAAALQPRGWGGKDEAAEPTAGGGGLAARSRSSSRQSPRAFVLCCVGETWS